jgi:hypothetical protein
MRNASIILLCSVLCFVGLLSDHRAESQGAPAPVMKAKEIKCSELHPALTKDTNCPECLKDHPLSSHLVATENANSPMYVEIPKNEAYFRPATPAGDGGHLLMVDLVAPGTIISVVPDCHGNVCAWIHGCDAAQCQGHNIPVEYHGDKTARWWAWTNSADNAALVFSIHYE